MSKAKAKNSKPASQTITKTISLPDTLAAEAEVKKIQPNPELDWSKYVRSLIRADLASV